MPSQTRHPLPLARQKLLRSRSGPAELLASERAMTRHAIEERNAKRTLNTFDATHTVLAPASAMREGSDKGTHPMSRRTPTIAPSQTSASGVWMLGVCPVHRRVKPWHPRGSPPRMGSPHLHCPLLRWLHTFAPTRVDTSICQHRTRDAGIKTARMLNIKLRAKSNSGI